MSNVDILAADSGEQTLSAVKIGSHSHTGLLHIINEEEDSALINCIYHTYQQKIYLLLILSIQRAML